MQLVERHGVVEQRPSERILVVDVGDLRLLAVGLGGSGVELLGYGGGGVLELFEETWGDAGLRLKRGQGKDDGAVGIGDTYVRKSIPARALISPI